MLIELRIRDFAVLEDLAMSLEPGLNVVSGETGAGKSIVVNALEVLLGGRASSGMVRSGAARAVVEGVADIEGLDGVPGVLEELGLQADDDLLVLRREVRSGGRSRAWLNGSPVTASVLRRIGSLLVDIHGQHEHQRLLSADFQREVLDAFGGHRELAERVDGAYRRVAELEGRIEDLEERRRELASRADFIRFRLGEIRGARIRAGEDEELRAEATRLANADLLARETLELQTLLHSGEDAVTDRLSRAATRLSRLSESDPALTSHAAALEDAYHRVAEAAAELAAYGSAIDHDPARLDELRERQAALQTLMRKYGPTLAAVIETGETLARELDEFETGALDAATLRGRFERAQAEWRSAAEDLSERRRRAAGSLSDKAEAIFPGLGLEGGRFLVEFEPLPAPSARGLERIRFMATMNPGFPPGPLSRIASGGELSRVMLALKSVLAGIDDLPTLVFDEIDAGIGGVVAASVGERLVEVARGRQVVAITHLARIAARAATHFAVEKHTVEGAAATRLKRLDAGARVREIARMLGGDPDSETSLNHARALLVGSAAPDPAEEAEPDFQ
ncbi:MAG: DNA repair protein RecN [Gemmatimonadetes bacterium]|nr:DNA repair protein RecN [Gemmatimonadota bacterium]